MAARIDGHRRVALSVVAARLPRGASYRLCVRQAGEDGRTNWRSGVACRTGDATWRAVVTVSRLCCSAGAAERRAAPSLLSFALTDADEARSGSGAAAYESKTLAAGIFTLLAGDAVFDLRRVINGGDRDAADTADTADPAAAAAAAAADGTVALDPPPTLTVSCALLPLDVAVEREARQHFDVFVLNSAQRTISRRDVQRALHSLGHHIDDDEAAAMVPDAAGGLSFPQFLCSYQDALLLGSSGGNGVLSKSASSASADQLSSDAVEFSETERVLLRAMFDTVDRDGTGALSVDDLRHHFNTCMGEELATADLVELIRAANYARVEGSSSGCGSGGASADANATVNFAAFEWLYRAGCGPGPAGEE